MSGTTGSFGRVVLVCFAVLAPLAVLPTTAGAAPQAQLVDPLPPAAMAAVARPTIVLTRNPAAPVQRRVPASQRMQAEANGIGVAPAQVPGNTCALGGIVWDDSNRDGLKTAGETGVSAAPVALRGTGSKVLTSVVTGPDGRYVFDNLPCGGYDISFTLPAGYRWTTPNVGNGANDSKAVDPGPGFLVGVTPLITVAPGEPATRPATAADGVQASFVNSTVDAGVVRAAQGPYVPAPAAPAPAAPPPAAPAPAAPVPAPAAPVPAPAAPAPLPGELAYTGTATEYVGWAGVGLLVVGIGLVFAGSRRPRRVVAIA